MRISGNQTTIREMFKLLDPAFKDPFKCYGHHCGCNDNLQKTRANTLVCRYQDKLSEDNFGCHFYDYEIEYDGDHITNIKLLHHSWTNSNILEGTVR